MAVQVKVEVLGGRDPQAAAVEYREDFAGNSFFPLWLLFLRGLLLRDIHSKPKASVVTQPASIVKPRDCHAAHGH
jgi:hypothetical protein